MKTKNYEQLVTSIRATGQNAGLLLNLGNRYHRRSLGDEARVCLELAVENGSEDARLPLAAVLMDYPLEKLTVLERYRRAENLLMELLKENGDDGDVCVQLCTLYQKLRRPISALAFGLRAKRLGWEILEETLNRLQQKLMNHPISAIREDPVGSRVLGLEYARNEKTLNAGVYFLREVADSSNDGAVALQLADILCFQTKDLALANMYYAMAARQRNPDLVC